MKTNEYNNQVIMYWIICANFKAHSDKETQQQNSRDIYETDSIRWYNHLRLTTIEKYDNSGKVDTSDLTMIKKDELRYIPSIT